MLSLARVTLRRGPRVLFQDADLAIHAGWRVGLTGTNGSGKSSLLAALRGALAPDAGEVSVPSGWRVAHVAQDSPSGDTPAVEHVLAGDSELASVRAALAEARAAGDGAREANLHARLESVGGYAAHARAARIMHGLGFAASQERASVGTLSGGWRRRLALARTLMARADLLLLDEPTNHLDLDAVLWLESWLRRFAGTLVVVAHDREFLDRVVDHVLHIENGRLHLHTGNYSDFERARAERLARQQAAHGKQEREITRVRAFADRFRAKATKARQVQSRLKALAAMERIAPAHVDSPFRFGFAPPDALPHPLLVLEDAAAGHDHRAVLAGVRMTLAPGDRVALLGANGAGKSTLMRLLACDLAPLAGRVERAPRLRTGYFAQHQVEQLRAGASPLAHLARIAPDAREQDLRDHLGGFGFRGDRALDPVATLSGGERARLVLALIVRARPNLLLLDEPTNHLDLEMRHALTLALQDFAGAMVIVAHDRHLLRAATDELWRVGEGRVRRFDGDLDQYTDWLRRGGADTDAGADSARDNDGADADPKRARRRRAALARDRLRPLRDEAARREAEAHRLGAAVEALEHRLADPALYCDDGAERLRALLVEKGRLDRERAAAEEAWLEAQEAVEAARGAREKAADERG